MSNASRWLGVLVVCFALGCSSDDNNGSSAGAGAGAAATGAAATGAVGGAAATGAGAAAAGVAGGVAGTSGTAGGMPVGTVDNCGGVACTVAPSLQSVAPACCNPMSNTCGMMGPFGCVAAYNDPGGHSCPSEVIMNMTIPGCCVDGMQCGIVDTLAGTGCAARSLAGFVVSLLDPNVQLSPINCDGTIPPPPATPDGGTTTPTPDAGI